MAKKSKIKPITAERFERELAALNRVYSAGYINANQHKARYDALLKRLHQVDGE